MADNLEDKLEQLIKAEKLRIRDFPLEAYVPNKNQLKAHMSQAKTILYVGGNRSGKSTFGAAEIVMHSTLDYPDWYPKYNRFTKPIKAAVSATSFPIVQTVIEPKLFSFLPKGGFTFKRTPQGYIQRVRLKSGSVIDILTSEMRDEAYESADWDVFWNDEPQTERKYKGIVRGLVDRDGKFIATFTPLTEAWMKEALVDRADGKEIFLVQANIRDNLKDIEGQTILNEKAIKRFEESLSEDEKETRISGKFFHLRGQIYKSFSEVHIDKDMTYNGVDYVICVLDPHDRLPHHLIWAAIDRDEDVYVLKESVVHMELPELARHIKDMEKAHGYKVKKRIIDPNFGRKPSRSGSNVTVMKELQKNGATFTEGNDDVELGHMMVREYLHYDTKRPVTAVNRPKLFFHPECKETIRSMRNLQYEEWQGKLERDPKEAQRQKGTHGADCIRYLIVSRPRFGGIKQFQLELSGPAY